MEQIIHQNVQIYISVKLSIYCHVSTVIDNFKGGKRTNLRSKDQVGVLNISVKL